MEPGGWGKDGGVPGRWPKASLRVPVAPASCRRALKSSRATLTKHVPHETKDEAGQLQINSTMSNDQVSRCHRAAPSVGSSERRGEKQQVGNLDLV